MVRFFLSLAFVLFLGCAVTPEENPCLEFECGEDETCLIVDGEPECRQAGTSGDGDGDGDTGDQCQSDEDCTPPLECLPDINGVNQCI